MKTSKKIYIKLIKKLKSNLLEKHQHKYKFNYSKFICDNLGHYYLGNYNNVLYRHYTKNNNTFPELRAAINNEFIKNHYNMINILVLNI